MVFYERLGRDIDRGLVGFWKLDDLKVSTSIAIGRANFNDGTIVGATNADGQNWSPSNSMSFDGIDNEVDIPHSSSLAITGPMTMMAWFNTNTILIPNGHRMILTMRDRTYISLKTNGVAEPFVSMDIGDSQETLDSNFSPSINTWYLVTATWDGTNIRIYVDGVLKNTSVDYSGDLSTGEGDKFIGRYSGAGFVFSGLMNNVRIYNRALTIGEISKVYRLRL